MASMLASDPDNSWFRIATASAIMAVRPALTSASTQFSMPRRFVHADRTGEIFRRSLARRL